MHTVCLFSGTETNYMLWTSPMGLVSMLHSNSHEPKHDVAVLAPKVHLVGETLSCWRPRVLEIKR